MLINFIKPDFQFSDQRGCLYQLAHSGWNQINFIFSRAGTLRGNHYHKVNKEAFFVINGNFKLSISTLDSSVSETYELNTGDFFIINPNLIHSFSYLTDTSLISFYDKGVELSNGNKDIFVKN